MSEQLLEWNIYEINSNIASLNGVMLRGRIRKFGLDGNYNVLVENTEDSDNSVRFAVLTNDAADNVSTYVKTIIPDATIELKIEKVINPVLSKLKVNQASRYTL